MKTLNPLLIARAAGTGLMCFLLMLLSSCLKDHNTYIAPPTTALLMASADAPAENLYLNADRVNAQPLNYEDYIGYFNAYTGKRQVILYNSTTSAQIVADSIHLNPNIVYTLFLANTYTHPDLILLTDSVPIPAIGKAAIRFVNVSPDAGTVDLATGSTTVLINGQPYKGASSFIPVTGDSLYNFSFRVHGSSTVIASLNSVRIHNNSVYTVWLRGLAAGSGTQKVSGGILYNAHF